MDLQTIYKVKDSVDLFLNDGVMLTAYYMNTRQRKSFKVSKETVSMIEHIDGYNTVENIMKKMTSKHGIANNDVAIVLESLEKNRLITSIEKGSKYLSEYDYRRYDRQINYFAEFFENEQEGELAQKRVMDSKVLIFGCGSVGGNLAMQLAMAGVNKFILFDYDIVNESDLSRHIFFDRKYVGQKKIDALEDRLQAFDARIQVEKIDQNLCPKSQIEELINKADFIINTLDEPYIGYTSSKISRICIVKNKSHFICGGFDAHLASTGELIIPYVTPCVECYAEYFKVRLKDWKPKKHPVKVRVDEIGGIVSMTLFSTSFAAIEIIKYLGGLVQLEDNFKIRGEFLFNDMSLTYLNVKKNPECQICGGKA